MRKNVEQPRTLMTRPRFDVKRKAYLAWMPNLDGQRGNGGDDELAAQAAVARPQGICVIRDGIVTLGDTKNHCVQSLTADAD